MQAFQHLCFFIELAEVVHYHLPHVPTCAIHIGAVSLLCHCCLLTGLLCSQRIACLPAAGGQLRVEENAAQERPEEAVNDGL